MPKTEIVEIVLRVNDKELRLSPEEARELKKTLNDAFPNNKTQWVPYIYPYQLPYPYYPTYITSNTSYSDLVQMDDTTASSREDH